MKVVKQIYLNAVKIKQSFPYSEPRFMMFEIRLNKIKAKAYNPEASEFP